MNLLVKTLTEAEVQDLRADFTRLDLDGTGMVNAEELSKLITEKHLNLSGKEIAELIREVDYQGNGKINYSEFLSATIDVKRFLSEQRLRAIFQQFDTDNSGSITAQNIVYAFEKLGQNVPLTEIEAMIQ